MEFKTILASREGRIATVALNRPGKRNALSIEMRNELDACLGALADEKAISCVVLVGEGAAFCAGFDKSEFGATEPERIEALRDSSSRHHRRLAEFPKPIVAGIHGAAFGGGFDVAVLCDVRIAATDAAFAHPEIKFGAPVLFGPLREIIGGGLARDLCLTGRKIDAQEALRIGLVSRIVEPGDLRAACMETACMIAEAPLAALLATKRQVIDSHGGWDGHHAGGSGLFDFF